jgi:hypothetical protein
MTKPIRRTQFEVVPECSPLQELMALSAARRLRCTQRA